GSAAAGGTAGRWSWNQPVGPRVNRTFRAGCSVTGPGFRAGHRPSGGPGV
ncbi:MAG: hypothetical protein AVDCRST_MAG57-217, partial [uncultured Blastococcus sp.]